MRKRPKSRWARFSEETNALDYLAKTYFFIQEARKDVNAWKWVILCVHSALYGFAVCALKGTNPANVTNKQGWLINFPEAIKRCQDPKWMRMTVASKFLQLTPEQDQSINRLQKEFRNNFEHYVPKLWAIEVSGMPKIISHNLEAVRFLALESGNYAHFNQSQIIKIKSLIFRSQKLLKKT